MSKRQNAHEIVDRLICDLERELYEVYHEREGDLEKKVSSFLKNHNEKIAGAIEQYETEKIGSQKLKTELLLAVTTDKGYKDLCKEIAEDVTNTSEQAFDLIPEYEQKAFDVSFKEEETEAKGDHPGVIALLAMLAMAKARKKNYKNPLNRYKEYVYVYRNIKAVFTSTILTLGAKIASPYTLRSVVNLSSKQKAEKAAESFASELSRNSIRKTLKKSLNSARNIARTKMTYWENRGRQAVYSTMYKAGIDGVKIWCTQEDERVRESHRKMDGVSVPFTDPFECGGYEMMFPGDSSKGAPAELIYNCRCYMKRQRQ